MNQVAGRHPGSKPMKVLDANTKILDTQHSDQIHDSQADHFGKRLATCSSDGTIKVFNLDNDSVQLIATLEGHKGPVWRVAWAHPKFGTLLASCSFDGTVKVWKQEGGTWWTAWENNFHSASVNSVAWAPHEYGLILASASSDGQVSVSTCKGGTWDIDSFTAHELGCCAVTWAPSDVVARQTSPGTHTEENLQMNLATGGCDNIVKIWANVNGKWVSSACLKGHRGWIRDVSFSPNTRVKTKYLASCSEDKSVHIWTKQATQKTWNTVMLKLDSFPDTVWRLSWSTLGNLLAATCGDGSVSLWKESLDGSWDELKTFD